MKRFTVYILILISVSAVLFPVNVFIAPRGNDAVTCYTESAHSAVELPIIMYHSILNHRKSKYIVSEKQLETDLQTFKENGYTAIFASELLAYVNGTGTLPQKPILITFDDGHYNNYLYGLPLLKKYNFKAVINIVGAYCDFSTSSGDHSNANYSYLTWQQIKEIANSGYFEIGNHTFNMHKFKPRNGIGRLKGECEEEYRKAVAADVQKLQDKFKNNSHINTNIFAYPFGKFNKIGREVLISLGFDIIFTCTEGVNIIRPGDFNTLHNLKRYNRDGCSTAECLIRKFEQDIAKQRKADK